MSVKNDQVYLQLVSRAKDLFRCLAASDDYVLNRLWWDMLRRRPPEKRAILPDLRIVSDLTVYRSIAAIDAKRYGFRDVQKNDLRSMRLGNRGCVVQRLDRSSREIDRHQNPAESNRWNRLRLERPASNGVSSRRVHLKYFRRWPSYAFHGFNIPDMTIIRFSVFAN